MKMLLSVLFIFGFSVVANATCESETTSFGLDGYAVVKTDNPSMGAVCFQLYADRMEGTSFWINLKVVKESWKMSNRRTPENIFGLLDSSVGKGPSMLIYIIVHTETSSIPRLQMLVSTSEEADCETINCGPFRIWYSGMSKGEVFHSDEFRIDDDGSRDLYIVLSEEQIDTLLSMVSADKAYVDFGEGQERLTKTMQDAMKETIHVFQNHLDQLVEK